MKTDTILSKSSISTAGLALKTAMECQQNLPVKNVIIIGASGKIGSIVLKDALDFQELNILSRQDTNCRTRYMDRIGGTQSFRMRSGMNICRTWTLSSVQRQARITR